jgi:hypothetical protein
MEPIGEPDVHIECPRPRADRPEPQDQLMHLTYGRYVERSLLMFAIRIVTDTAV